MTRPPQAPDARPSGVILEADTSSHGTSPLLPPRQPSLHWATGQNTSDWNSILAP